MERKIYISMIVVAIVTMFVTAFSITQLFYDFYLDSIEENLISISELYLKSNMDGDLNLDNNISIKKYNKSTLPDPLNNTSKYDTQLSQDTILRVSVPIASRQFMILSSLAVFVAVSIFIIIFLHLVASYLADDLMHPIKVASQSMEDILDDKPVSNEDIYPEFIPFISNINSSREQIRYYVGKLQDNEKFRREFTANVSHELKTPLTSINGYAELLEHGIARNEDIQEIGGRINQEGKRLLDLIEDIIELSNLDSPEMEIEFENINIYEIVHSISKKLDYRLDKKNIDLNIKGKDRTIYGNKRMIKDLIYNLLDNAIKYNKEYGSIDIEVASVENHTYLSVSDTGIGISDEDLERIFERFYMVNKSRTKPTQGTGLGLSIVKNIVEIHQGNINIHSELNKGTTIEIIF